MSLKHRPSVAAGAPSRLIRLALWGSAVLLVFAAAAFYFASNFASDRKSAIGGAVVVTITTRNCDPDQITVPAGHTTFQVVNRSDRAVEWEILDGVMVVEERENIAPGFTQRLTAKLAPGSYAMTCGLLGNPRGVLHVTPSESAAAQAAAPAQRAYIGPLAEYRVYLIVQARKLAAAVDAMAKAIAREDLPQAKALYVVAHNAYMHIGPATPLFADLDQRINAQSDDFEQRQRDPAFTGFHRIETALFERGATADAGPAASQLVADVAMLQTRIRALKIPPDRLAYGAARSVQKLSVGMAGQSADGPVLVSDMRSGVQGAVEIIDLLRPLLIVADPALLSRIDADFKAAHALLDGHEPGVAGRDRIGMDGHKQLIALLTTLAADIDTINPRLGLD